MLYTASNDNNAYSWDLAAGKAVVTFAGHTADVQDVSSMEASHSIATASEDGTAKIWGMLQRRDKG